MKIGWLAMVVMMAPAIAAAADYPAPQPANWEAKNFRFHTGEVMALTQHYLTIGNPKGAPVLLLHGTGGTGASLLTPAFAGQLFGPGQPLDAAKYFLILPDAIGTGGSSKPSDGLKAKFPHYNYDDIVAAQHRLLTEGLHIRHLRLVIGNSMGGMLTWVWGTAHPGFMDGLAPLASQPTPMGARNWATRRALIEVIRRDPAYQDGNYSVQPSSLKTANVLYGAATSGGTLAWAAEAPTRAAADGVVKARLAAPGPTDANDFIWQWESGRDYAPDLSLIAAPVLAVNSADDERNSPETGLTANALKKMANAKLVLIPASSQTHGHGTTGNAAFWQADLAAFLAALPHRQP